MTIKDIFISWDFIISGILGIICWLLFPDIVIGSILKEIYFTAITVLAIIFPIFFAALAIMMSFSDNEFVDFLEEDGIFGDLLSQFSFSISVLFCTLIASLILYGHVIFNLYEINFGHLKVHVVLFVTMFFYTLIAVFLSTLDAIRYLKNRIKFIRFRHRGRNKS